MKPSRLLALLFLLPLSLVAQNVPPLVNYQGRLLNPDGSPLATANYQLSFKVYDASAGGNLVWGPQVFDGTTALGHGATVPVVQGYFNVLLGPSDANGLSLADAFDGTNRFVEVTVSNHPPIAPRQQILTSPFAFQAANATTAALASNVVNGLKITNAVITDSVYAGDGSGLANLNASQLTSGAVASSLLPSVPARSLTGTVGNGQLAYSSLDVIAGTGLTGGGPVSLGGSTTLNNAGVLSVTGNADITASKVGGAVTLGDTATSSNTASTIVKRDGTGSFSADNITLNGALNLPAITASSPDIIYSGSALLLWGDNNGNFFSGQNAGNSTNTGGYNTANGYNALENITGGSYNTANGCQALSANTGGLRRVLDFFYWTGAYNTANGYQALLDNTTGAYNTANGAGALSANTTGSDNTADGDFALSANTTGSDNIALGADAGTAITTGSDNIDIGNAGVSGDSGIIRIGTQGTQTACYLAGTVYANGTFVSSSDRSAKENFKSVDTREVLEKVAAMPVSRWNYKQDAASEHLGPMAQDFYAAFHVGPDDRHIATVDEEGVALAAIQGLNRKLEQEKKEKDAEIQTLKQQNNSLANRLNELEAMVKSLAEKK